jgi:DNA repair ATPase RecN
MFPAMGLLFIACMACNDGGKKKETGTKGPKTQADSLMEDVMDGHDVGMSKYGKLEGSLKKVQQTLDSIATLPAKARQAAAPLKAQLESVASDLNYAITAMDKWMQEFNMDSAINNMEERIRYLTDEKMKVGKVKEAILNSLQKADSVLKARF